LSFNFSHLSAKLALREIDSARMGIYGNDWSRNESSFLTRRRLHTSTGIPLMARKKISTTVYITPEQNEALHILHNRTKVPVAVYIREGIDLVLQKYADQLPGQMSLVDTGDRK
jgi:Ribbon-helix-helix domain